MIRNGTIANVSFPVTRLQTFLPAFNRAVLSDLVLVNNKLELTMYQRAFIGRTMVSFIVPILQHT
jgi:hypothetical protein